MGPATHKVSRMPQSLYGQEIAHWTIKPIDEIMAPTMALLTSWLVAVRLDRSAQRPTKKDGRRSS